MIKKILIILIILSQYVLISCQSKEALENIVFDNSQFKYINIYSSKKVINQVYQTKFLEPYIDHSLVKSPSDRFSLWAEENIKTFGNENKLYINILEASLKRTEVENKSIKKYQEKIIYYFELNYLVEFLLYDENNDILATTIVETNRSTTSSKFISILESEKLIDELILNSLIDLTLESEKLIKIHMSKFIL